MLLLNKTLFAECYLETSVDFYRMFTVILHCMFYSETFIDFNRISTVTQCCICHVHVMSLKDLLISCYRKAWPSMVITLHDAQYS